MVTLFDSNLKLFDLNHLLHCAFFSFVSYKNMLCIHYMARLR